MDVFEKDSPTPVSKKEVSVENSFVITWSSSCDRRDNGVPMQVAQIDSTIDVSSA